MEIYQGDSCPSVHVALIELLVLYGFRTVQYSTLPRIVWMPPVCTSSGDVKDLVFGYGVNLGQLHFKLYPTPLTPKRHPFALYRIAKVT